jgi:hypothetical protein
MADISAIRTTAFCRGGIVEGAVQTVPPEDHERGEGDQVTESKRPPEEVCAKCGHLFGERNWKTYVYNRSRGTDQNALLVINREDERVILRMAEMRTQRTPPDIKVLRIAATKFPDEKNPEVRHFCQRCG